MKKTSIYTLAVVIICNFFLAFSAFAENSAVIFNREPIIIHTEKGNKSYNVEIATSNEQLEHGLMNRESLAENEGMLFLFDHEQIINMWMKNTLIPLDMLFIDNTGKIVHIAHNAVPNSLTVINAGDKPVLSVLELKGGAARAHNINIGNNVDYKAFKK